MSDPPLPGYGLGQLALTVPVHARDPQDLAGVHPQRHVDETDLPAPAFDAHLNKLERHMLGDRARDSTSAGLGPHLGHVGQGRGLSAEHQPDDIRLQLPARSAVHHVRPQLADHAAPAQDGDPIAHGQRLAQLVRDEHDGESLSLETEQDLLQLGDAQWCEHGGRFVEDQNTGTRPECLHDLHVLLLPQRQPAREGFGIDPHAQIGGGTFQGAPGRLGVQAQCTAATMAPAHHQVLQDREHRDQGGVLIDRADAVIEGGAGRPDVHFDAIHEHQPGIGPAHPREDVHQRGFAGPVLSQDAVDLARVEGDRHGVQCHHAGEDLGGLTRLHDWGQSRHRGHGSRIDPQSWNPLSCSGTRLRDPDGFRLVVSKTVPRRSGGSPHSVKDRRSQRSHGHSAGPPHSGALATMAAV